LLENTNTSKCNYYSLKTVGLSICQTIITPMIMTYFIQVAFWGSAL
jgi:hypothetical protein